MLRLLIADDEELERRALRRFVQGVENVTVVAEARNGLEAVQLAAETLPDLALVDIKMPGMSGLEAIREIAGFRPQMKSVIITAYEEFAFAQEALKLGAVDYLLKPAPADQVMAVIRKTAKAALQEREQAETRAREQFQTTRPAMRKALVLDLISDTADDASEMAARATAVGLSSLPTVAIAVSVDKPAGAAGGKPEEQQELKNEVSAVLERVAAKQEVCLTIPVGGDGLVIAYGPPDNNLAETLALAEEVRAQVAQETPATVTVGVGRPGKRPGQLSESYQDAVTAVQLGRLFLGTNRVIHAAEVLRLGEGSSPGMLELEKDLCQRVREGDTQAASAGASRLLDTYLGPRGLTPEALRMRLLELAVVLSRAAADGGADGQKALSMLGPTVWSLQECRTADQFGRWLQETVDRYAGLVAGTYSSPTSQLMKRITDHLDKHYADAISITDVAGMAYLNVSYFCRVFRKHTGRTFVEYLTELRLVRARHLLASTDEPVGVIANKVGYSDSNYFSRVFARFVGLSPTDYRKQAHRSGGRQHYN